MASQIRTAIDFYDRHPISAQMILTKLQAARGTLNGLRPDELFRTIRTTMAASPPTMHWPSARI